MSRNTGASGQAVQYKRVSEKSVKDYLHYLPDWRKLKSLPLDSQERSDLKQFLYHAFLPEIVEDTKFFIAQKLPKKSLLQDDDIIQAVRIRMWHEMERYDCEFGIDFKVFFNTHVNSRLKGAVNDETRRLMNFGRKYPKRLRELKARMLALSHKISREPTIEDYLDEYGWDLLKDMQDPLLFSQVFNQSNTRPGEHLEDELRFEGDRRRQQALPYVSKQMAKEAALEMIAAEARILRLIPDQHCQTVILKYYFHDWSITRIAKATGFSTTLVSRRMRRGEEYIWQAFDKSHDKFKNFIESSKLPSKLAAKIWDKEASKFPEERVQHHEE